MQRIKEFYMNDLISNSFEITQILIACIGVSLVPTITVKIAVKVTKFFISLMTGGSGNNVKI